MNIKEDKPVTLGRSAKEILIPMLNVLRSANPRMFLGLEGAVCRHTNGRI